MDNIRKDTDYRSLLTGITELLETARQAAVRKVDFVMTSTYWEIGRRIVENDQGGAERACYGDEVLKGLSADLTDRFGKGFSLTNLKQFRKFYRLWQISPKGQTVSDIFSLPLFQLPWSQYVQLLSMKDKKAREFYEAEALRGGWTVRQLRRQIGSQFYERTLLSKNKAAGG